MNRLIHAGIIFGLFLVAGVGCTGDGATIPDVAPVITAVTPSGEVGAAGETVQFSATASGSPTAWQWDFGSGAFPLTSTDDAPEVTLLASASYTGTVIATNAVGSSEPFGFTYHVGASDVVRVIDVTPAAPTGFLGDTVTFEAVTIGDPTAWEWDFGGATTISTSDAEAPTVVLNNVGDFTGSVRVSSGVLQSLPHEFPIQVARWQELGRIGEVAVGDHYRPSAVLYRDRVAVAATSRQNEVHLLRALTADPRTSSDWVQSAVPVPPGWPDTELAVVGGRLMLANRGYLPQNGKLRVNLAHALVDEPTVPTDWRVSEVAEGILGEGMGEFEGRAALTFSRNNLRVWVARALTDTPSGEADWALTLIDENPGSGNWPELVISDTRLGVIYQIGDATTGFGLSNTGVGAAIAQTAHPASAADWSRHVIEPKGTQVHTLDAAMLDGHPAVAYYTLPNSIGFARATVPHPSATEDWVRTVITNTSSGSPSLIELDGRPVVGSQSEDGSYWLTRPFELEDPGLEWELDLLTSFGTPFAPRIIPQHDHLFAVYGTSGVDPLGIALTFARAEGRW